MPYLHLPVQSGSDRILEAMNRRHGRDLFLRSGRSPAQRAARSRAVVRLHRRLPGRERCRFRRHDAAGRAGRLRLGLLLQVQPPSRHAGRGAWATRSPKAVKIGAARRPAGAARPAGARSSTPPRPAPTVPVLFAEPGRKPGQLIGKTPWLQSVYAEGDAAADRPHRRGAAARRPRQQPGRRDRHRPPTRPPRERHRAGADVRATIRCLVELYGSPRPQPRAHRAARRTSS